MRYVCNSRIKADGKVHNEGAVVDLDSKSTATQELLELGRIAPAAEGKKGEGKNSEKTETGEPK